MDFLERQKSLQEHLLRQPEKTSCTKIFQHAAPRGGLKSFRLYRQNRPQRFSLAGGDNRLKAYFIHIPISIPAPSRGATPHGYFGLYPSLISIPAPSWEATEYIARGLALIAISIPAPLAGGDAGWFFRPSIPSVFQSPPPSREATAKVTKNTN